jgi:TonB family protein
MRTPVPGLHAQHGKIMYFLALSVLAHLFLMLPPVHTPMTIQVPAPELSVTTLSAGTSALAVTRKESRRTESAAVSSDTARADSWREDETSSLPSETIVNNLRSLLRTELDKHFVYPPVARRNSWQGRVDIVVRFDHEGRLHALRIVHSSGYAILDQDALLTLQKIGTIPQARAWLRGYSYDTQLPVLYRLTEG